MTLLNLQEFLGHLVGEEVKHLNLQSLETEGMIKTVGIDHFIVEKNSCLTSAFSFT